MLTPSDQGGELAKASLASLVGQLVGGKYRLKRLLGHGGMGSVYKAENVVIGRTVAVKILHAHLADDGVTLARFQREARVAASAGHEHVVEVLDMGIEPSGAPYIVMEYVRGRSLATLLALEPVLDVARAARIAGGILAGLEAVHARGVVHRDLKPENVLLTAKGGNPDFVKIFDFGISTFVESMLDPLAPYDLTPSGRTMGTPHYASPEQIQGERGRDARVDIYAVGVLLYQMLAGRRPFEVKSFPDLCRAILHEEPPPLSALRPDVPAGLEAIVRRALAKRAEDRHPRAQDMALALVPFGAEPLEDEPEPTDTFTWQMRELRAREVSHRRSRAADETAAWPAPAASIAGAEVRGEVLCAICASLRDRLGGPRFERLLDDAEPEVAAVLRRRIDPEAWHSSDVFALLERADREYGAGDRRMIAEAGRRLARARIGCGGREALSGTLTPELLFAMMADLWGRFFAAGAAQVTKATRGHGRLQVGALPRPDLLRSVVMLGFLDEALRMVGARDVDVRLVSSVALGDPVDVYEATWSS